MGKESSRPLAPATIGVKQVPTESLIPNPHNPRMLFDRVPLDILKESVGKVGILVPLTVYWGEKDASYIILDGQRRWLCAKELGLKDVPVNQVAQPTLVQNIVTMFQIHKLREDWELMPTALKLEVLMRELNERNERKLAALTGLDQAVVVRCKKLLSYSRRFQDLMLHVDPAKRVKADFFIELYVVVNDRFVRKVKWFSKDVFTQRMLEKYQTRSSGLKAVTDFRLMKQLINNAQRAKKDFLITKKLEEFTFDDELTLQHLVIQSASTSAQAKKLVASIQKVEDAINLVDVDEYYGEEELWEVLEKLLKLIRGKLLAAGRRLKE